MSQLETLRGNITRLFDAYCEATGAGRVALSVQVARDPKFVKSYLERDMRIGTYDMVVSRFSAIWPQSLPWPEGISRPAPYEASDDDDGPRAPRSRLHPEWPAGVPWPEDIPLPETVNP